MVLCGRMTSPGVSTKNVMWWRWWRQLQAARSAEVVDPAACAGLFIDSESVTMLVLLVVEASYSCKMKGAISEYCTVSNDRINVKIEELYCSLTVVETLKGQVSHFHLYSTCAQNVVHTQLLCSRCRKQIPNSM